MKLKVFVGWDAKDADAYRVCKKSLMDHTSVNVEVIPLKDWQLRAKGLYIRSHRVDANGQAWDDVDGKPFSTSFSFTRFAVPLLAKDEEVTVFVDADVLFRGDVAELIGLAMDNPDCAVLCVHHDHTPVDKLKMTGVLQTQYRRKNWSSVMVLRPSLCEMSLERLNSWTGQQLHALEWVPDSRIGKLPEAWNWLEGWSSSSIDPKLVHFTRGTPDMPGYENIPYADEWRAVWETCK
jgi:hypothetical protein